jgi:glucose/arabinose dehydrogenase
MPAIARVGLLLTLAAPTAIALGCGGGGGEDTTTKSSKPPLEVTTITAPNPPSGKGGVAALNLGTFDQPVYIAQPPDDRRNLFVVERTGAIRILSRDKKVEQPFLNLRGKVATANDEQGLLSMAFAPDYAKSGLFYVDYTDTSGDTRVVEYRRSYADPLRADPGSAREVLGVHQPFDNHNGGLVTFGPDGYLYIGLGDGGSEDDPMRNGQKLSTLLGKILRIDPRPSGGKPYSIPPSNPFVGRAGARPEIYAYGLRNPWRFSFDRRTGALVIGDVGQDTYEEVDYVPRGMGAGANFGWSAFEGDARFNKDQTAPGAVKPVLVYNHDGGACSITGGYVVRDRRLKTLYGRYLYTDYCNGNMRSFIPRGGKAVADRPLDENLGLPSSFGEDSSGRIYLTTLIGEVYRLVPG